MDSRLGKQKRGTTPQEKNIQVVVRCRPRNAIEKRAASSSVVECNTGRGEVHVKQKEIGDKTGTKTFTFDKVFGPNSTQIEVYKGVVHPIIEEVLQGYNCTVFAYGQTGTGKTYSMEGERTQDNFQSWEQDPLAGIIPRSLQQLFEQLESQSIQEYSVRVSFLELYNEELFDLLSTGHDSSKLRIFEDSTRKGSVVIQGLEELTVNDKNEVFSILERGAARRQTAATLLNACSSRSHSVFSVTVHMKESSIDGEEMLKTGKLNLVDLAGSENIGRSGAVDKRAREAGNINQSLLTLGRVITSLVERGRHVPYRESKLTRILQDSLGGRTKTSIIATISPAQCNMEETLSTLDYAHRAKNITNRPEINQKLSKKALIKEYTEEIERLKRDLVAAREKNGIFLSAENYNDMEKKIKTQKELTNELEEKIRCNIGELKKLNDMFTDTKQELEETSQQLVETSNHLNTTRVQLSSTRHDLHVTQTERNEKHHLVQEHVKSEQALLSEAGELLDVVHDTIGDVQGLHSKLDRTKTVENSNQAATSQFRGNFGSQVVSLRESMESFSNSQKQMCKEFSGRIEEWSSTSASEVQSIQQAVGGMLACVLQFVQQRQESAKENCASMKTNISDIKNTTHLFKDELSDQISQELCSTLLPRMQHLSQLVTKHSDTVTHTTNDMKTQLSSQWENTSQFVAQQQTKLAALSTEVSEHSMNQVLAMRSHQDALSKASASQMTLTKQLHESILNQVSSLLQSAWENQQEEFTTNLEKVSSDIQSTSESQQSHDDHMKQSFQALSSDAGSYGEDFGTAVKEVTTSMDTLVSEHEQLMDEEDKAITTLKASLSDSMDKLKQSTEKYTNDANTRFEALCDETVKITDESCRNLEAHGSSISASCGTIQSSLEATAKQSIQGAARQWNRTVDDLSEHVGALAIRQSQLVEDTQAKVDRYLTEELKRDIPTGMTPQRRDFHYPSQLTKTRPHSELLEEYKSEGQKIQLPELPESDSEEECETTESTDNSPTIPSYDLDSQDSLCVSMDTTTTSVDITDSSEVSINHSSNIESFSELKENEIPKCTSRLPVSNRKKHYNSHDNSQLRSKTARKGIGSSTKKQPLAVVNKQ